MGDQSSIRFWSKLAQFISLFGLCLIPLMILRVIVDPPASEAPSLFMGLIFIVICSLGGIAGIRPSACSFSRASDLTKANDSLESSSQPLEDKPNRRGHHVECDHFSSHILNIGENVFCAGCTGLSTGASFAIIGSFLYFFAELPLPNATVYFWIGFTGVAVGITQHYVYNVAGINSGPFRFLLNFAFVSGAFLLLIASDQLASSFFLDVYILLIVLFWIFTRIIMSRGEHQRICAKCDLKSCHNN